MNAIKANAHKAGAIYLLFSLVAIVGEFLFPAFMVSGDATATASRITDGLRTYRLEILIGFVTLLIFIVLVASLHELLRNVDRKQALLMVLLVAVGVAVALANLIFKMAPVVLLGGDDYLAALSKAQVDALTLAMLEVHSHGNTIVQGFWGLWLFPFGILVWKSRMFPRILGALLIVAGVAYLTSSFTAIAWPDVRRALGPILTPLYIGEVPIVFWLLIKGAKVPQPTS